jgi:hypothetical protein
MAGARVLWYTCRRCLTPGLRHIAALAVPGKDSQQAALPRKHRGWHSSPICPPDRKEWSLCTLVPLPSGRSDWAARLALSASVDMGRALQQISAPDLPLPLRFVQSHLVVSHSRT